MSKFYIATSLDNVPQHHAIRDILVAEGHECTYDWTVHGAVQALGREVISRTSEVECKGVAAADFVVVILPGGRGTHCELGMALALGVPVYLCGPPHFFDTTPTGKTTCFYHHPGVEAICSYPEGEFNAPRIVNGIMAIEIIRDYGQSTVSTLATEPLSMADLAEVVATGKTPT